MNIFEDFIEELKEENLLEQTAARKSPQKNVSAVQTNQLIEVQTVSVAPREKTSVSVINAPVEKISGQTSDADYFRKKASNEVSFLQMVEYIVAGIERDQLKTIPQPYDDLEVKKALHSFLQISEAPDSPEHIKAQFQLLQETENWHSSLSRRDDRIMPAHLRRFLESSRPPLSSAALLSLAKFYRNSSYTERVRCKFDLVITRLFSKGISKGKRDLVFARRELGKHIAELYADWSSIPLYSIELNDPKIIKIVARFDEFMLEAEAAETFDDLIKEDFFKRLQGFKETAVENFFAPPVMAVAVECNVRIGNRYVQLLAEQKKKDNEANLQSRLEATAEQTITPIGKTFDLIEILKHKNAADKAERKNDKTEIKAEVKTALPSKENSKEVAATSFNKWLLAVPAIVILIFAVFYFAGKSSVSPNASETVQNKNVLKEYLQKSAINGDTLVGVVQPNWNQLSADKKTETLKQMLDAGNDKGYIKIQLMNGENKLIASAGEGKIKILD